MPKSYKQMKRTPFKRKPKERFYEDKLVECVICGDEYWRHDCPPHHIFGRNSLSKAEIKDERFFIDLAMPYHFEFHNSEHESGLIFYEKYKLLDLICQQCGFDSRLLSWIAGQRYKIKQMETK